MAYCGYVVKVEKLEKHPNADRLQLATFFGSTTCVSLEVKVGDVGIYFPSDGQLSVEFCDVNHLCRKNSKGEPDIGYLDPDKRNIKAIKLRGTFSDGIFCSLESLNYLFEDQDAKAHLKIGDLIDTVAGREVCKKYIPYRASKTSTFSSDKGKHKTSTWDKETTPFFAEHIDTPQLRFCEDKFQPGDIICLTEKVHGTSSRNANTLVYKHQRNWLDKLLRRPGKEINFYKYVVGTRRTTVRDNSLGYYESEDFRIQWGKKFIGHLRQGEEVFGEIAGWVNPNQTIMQVGSNAKVDKDFVTKYGKTTTFSYGCSNVDETKPLNRYFIYRITYTTPEGDVIEYPWDMVKYRAEQLGFEVVPELERFIYTTQEDFDNRIKKYLDIPSTIDPSHIIEGVVVRALNKVTFYVAKEKSRSFKILEGILKEEASAPDMEEAEELVKEIEE
jgi:tRNA-binding EMAP/Myf-like protein